eukprot:145412-Chlamydomonas_euryale.AAC.1
MSVASAALTRTAPPPLPPPPPSEIASAQSGPRPAKPSPQNPPARPPQQLPSEWAPPSAPPDGAARRTGSASANAMPCGCASRQATRRYALPTGPAPPRTNRDTSTTAAPAAAPPPSLAAAPRLIRPDATNPCGPINSTRSSLGTNR